MICGVLYHRKNAEFLNLKSSKSKRELPSGSCAGFKSSTPCVRKPFNQQNTRISPCSLCLSWTCGSKCCMRFVRIGFHLLFPCLCPRHDRQTWQGHGLRLPSWPNFVAFIVFRCTNCFRLLLIGLGLSGLGRSFIRVK